MRIFPLLFLVGCGTPQMQPTPVVDIAKTKPYTGSEPQWTEPTPKITQKNIEIFSDTFRGDVKRLKSLMDYVQNGWSR